MLICLAQSISKRRTADLHNRIVNFQNVLIFQDYLYCSLLSNLLRWRASHDHFLTMACHARRRLSNHLTVIDWYVYSETCLIRTSGGPSKTVRFIKVSGLTRFNSFVSYYWARFLYQVLYYLCISYIWIDKGNIFSNLVILYTPSPVARRSPTFWHKSLIKNYMRIIGNKNSSS